MASKNEVPIWNFLMSKINNPYGVAGLMGNLYAESGLNPRNLQNSGNKKYSLSDDEYTENIDLGIISKQKFCNDGYGYGLAQWTYKTRKEKLYNYCVKVHLSIGNLQAQLEYLWIELQKYTGVMKVLKAAKNIQEASDIVLLKYERPADQSEKVKKKRAKFGQEIFDRNCTIKDINSKTEKKVEEPKKFVRINRKSVNIRKGPGTKFPVVGYAYKGEEYRYVKTDEETGWHCIRFPVSKNCDLAWVTGKYTSIYEEG